MLELGEDEDKFVQFMLPLTSELNIQDNLHLISSTTLLNIELWNDQWSDINTFFYILFNHIPSQCYYLHSFNCILFEYLNVQLLTKF